MKVALNNHKNGGSRDLPQISVYFYSGIRSIKTKV